MFPRVTISRLLRLCLKELRESLRDRRTIVTLVLMPLLVYPLLSLVLNRVLLSNASKAAQATVRVGVSHDLTEGDVATVVGIGFTMLHDPTYAPVYLDRIVQDRKATTTDDTDARSPLPVPEFLQLSDSGREALRNSTVDIVISQRMPQDDLETPATDSEAAARRPNAAAQSLRRLTEVIQAYGKLPQNFDAKSLIESIGTYEVRYREGDPQSERALQVVERSLAAINNQVSRQLISPRYETPFKLFGTPVAMRSNYADLLATMVPLVLVLMTMAGAVYPAIDLTAGERERGTMESLIVSPTPASVILISKYSAVVTVALLTALANLGAMSITLWVSGIGKLVFGEGTFSAGVIGTILVLLVLFTMFFAALLLAVTSFAKSFKEAQAYLIPLMLLALTPGVMSLLPGIQFTSLLATVPLVNIVLLAREILMGTAHWDTAMIAVICNSIYALAALVIASRLFGSDASMQGSKGSWRDLMLRPKTMQAYPTIDQMALTMAIMFPVYFVASSLLPSLSQSLGNGLWLSALVSFVLILGIPLFVAWFRNLDFSKTFRLEILGGKKWAIWLPAILLIGCSSWMFAHEIFIAGQVLGIGTIDLQQFEAVAEFQEKLKMVPLWVILFSLAATPAICEEVLFRGFVMSAFHKQSAWVAIVVTSVLFGLMHVLTSNVLAVERFLPTTFMGLILGWIALRTGSLLPGIMLHALHNGLLLSMGYFETELKSRGILVSESEHLPLTWLATAAVMFIGGCLLFWLTMKKATSKELTPRPEPTGEPSVATEL